MCISSVHCIVCLDQTNYHILAPKDDPRRVVVQKMIFMSEGQTDIEKDLTGNSFLYFLAIHLLF